MLTGFLVYKVIIYLFGKKNKWLIDRGCLELSTSFGSTLNIADIIPLRTFSFCINSLKQKSTVGNIIKSSEFRDSATCVLSFCFPAVWAFNVCVFFCCLSFSHILSSHSLDEHCLTEKFYFTDILTYT